MHACVHVLISGDAAEAVGLGFGQPENPSTGPFQGCSLSEPWISAEVQDGAAGLQLEVTLEGPTLGAVLSCRLR